MDSCQEVSDLPYFHSLAQLPPSSRFSAIALFDLDHTLLSVNSSYYFGKFLYRQGVFSTSLMLKLAGIYALHKAGILSIRSLQIKIFRTLFEGRPFQFFHEKAQEFIQEFLKKIYYQPALQEFKNAQSQGAFVAILSSAPDFLVSLIAKEMGAVYWEATAYSIEGNGNFSHISRFLLGNEKGIYSSLCSKKLGVEKSNITAYTDSILDLPLLQSAGNKVAVRPDSKLKALSKYHRWRVI